jgi:uncharacterized RDD family membrane protein YckC
MTDNRYIAIVTPEGVTFKLPLAGPISRCMAWLLDFACIAVTAKIMGILVGLLGMVSTDFSRAVNIVIFFVLTIGYAILLEWHWNGQTLGKRVLGLRVIDVRGMRLHLSQIVIRNLLRAVDSLPLFYLVGGLAALFSRHAQRLGDLGANTIVIRSSKVVEPDLELILERTRYNSLRQFPHLTARLRQQVLPEEAGLALQALMRRDSLDGSARVDLFNLMAIHFKQKVTFPQEALEGVSDEQYVRNVVDVLFRNREV